MRISDWSSDVCSSDLDDLFEYLVNADAGFGGSKHRFGRVKADNILYLMPYLFRLRCGQVDLVDDRHDLMVMLDGLIDIGQRLRLDALRGIYDQQRAFTGREAAAHLIGKVHMAGCTHEVKLLGPAEIGTHTPE